MPEAILSVKDKLKKAKPQRRSYRMNLRGDIVVQIQQLEQDLEVAREAEADSSAQPRLGGPDTRTSTQVAQRIKDLEAEMDDGWLDLTLEAVPWAKWRDFKMANPPVEDDATDKNLDFHFAALTESDLLKECVVDPDLDAEDWGQVFAVCSPADIQEFALTCYLMHERTLDVPKSLRASAVLARSAAESKQQQGSESANDASTGGSPKSSTSTSTPTEPDVEPPTPT